MTKRLIPLKRCYSLLLSFRLPSSTRFIPPVLAFLECVSLALACALPLCADDLIIDTTEKLMTSCVLSEHIDVVKRFVYYH